MSRWTVGILPPAVCLLFLGLIGFSGGRAPEARSAPVRSARIAGTSGGPGPVQRICPVSDDGPPVCRCTACDCDPSCWCHGGGGTGSSGGTGGSAGTDAGGTGTGGTGSTGTTATGTSAGGTTGRTTGGTSATTSGATTGTQTNGGGSTGNTTGGIDEPPTGTSTGGRSSPEDVTPSDTSKNWIEVVTSIPDNADQSTKIAGLLVDDSATTGVSRTFDLILHYERPKDEGDIQWTSDPKATRYINWKATSSAPLDSSFATAIENSPPQSTIKFSSVQATFYRVSCTVALLKKNIKTGVETPINYNITHKGTFASIGGPLTLGVTPGKGAPRTWRNLDNERSKPFYLQYFPGAVQNPQSGKISHMIQPGTPGISKVDYKLPSFLELVLPAGPSGADVSTVALGEATPITVHFSYEYTNDDSKRLKGGTDDVTRGVKDLASPNNRLVNEFVARTPDSMSAPSATQFDPKPSRTLYDYRCGSFDLFTLYDDKKSPMPGIWVQERFTPVPDINDLKVNTESEFWTTKIDPAGVFDGYDVIWKGASKPFTNKTYVHKFFAATKYTGEGRPGIYLATYTISFTATSSFQKASQTGSK